MHLIRRLCRAPLRWPALAIPLALATPSTTWGTIAFQEVTQGAGIQNTGRTFGASWGDFNSDGLPDIWVGNHGRVPSLYLNQGDGTFQDIAGTVWPGPARDTHGATWADFDGDGRQDLLETVGGKSTHHLWVNEGGLIRDRATQLSVAFPGARGRDALWVDADRDGRLDVVLSHMSAPNLNTKLMLQGSPGFENATAEAGWSFLATHYTQLADLDGDGEGEIAVWGPSFPQKVYDLPLIRGSPLRDIRSALGFQGDPIAFAQDSALADFDGDLRTDVFVTKQRHNAQLAQPSSTQILARVNAISDERGISFQLSQPMVLSVFPTGRLAGVVPPNELIFIGANRAPATDFAMILDPEDPSVIGLPPHDSAEEGMWIGFDPIADRWDLFVSSAGSVAINVRVDAGGPITNATPIGIPGEMVDPEPNLYLATDHGFVESRTRAGLDQGFACTSVVSGDFDNDMDLDLFLACNHPIVNTPNKLLENLGGGVFRVVPNAGGAAGSSVGRSDVVITADYDTDGFLDLFVTNGEGDLPTNEGPHQLFKNAGNSNHWLELDLDEGPFNRTGRGSQVSISAGGRDQVRFQGGGNHRRGQDFERVHFGLGSNASADLRVRWPSGTLTTLSGVAANQIVTVRPTPVPEPRPGWGIVLSCILLARGARPRMHHSAAQGSIIR